MAVKISKLTNKETNIDRENTVSGVNKNVLKFEPDMRCLSDHLLDTLKLAFKFDIIEEQHWSTQAVGIVLHSSDQIGNVKQIDRQTV